MSEHEAVKVQLEEMTLRAKNAEAENRSLVDRWMLQKMQDAERLNEVLGFLYGSVLYFLTSLRFTAR